MQATISFSKKILEFNLMGIQNYFAEKFRINWVFGVSLQKVDWCNNIQIKKYKFHWYKRTATAVFAGCVFAK